MQSLVYTVASVLACDGVLYKQLHWFCEACDKAATDVIVVSTANHSGGKSMCKEDVKDIVTQVGEAIKEANECIKKTLVETLQSNVHSGSGLDMGWKRIMIQIQV